MVPAPAGSFMPSSFLGRSRLRTRLEAQLDRLRSQNATLRDLRGCSAGTSSCRNVAKCQRRECKNSREQRQQNSSAKPSDCTGFLASLEGLLPHLSPIMSGKDQAQNKTRSLALLGCTTSDADALGGGCGGHASSHIVSTTDGWLPSLDGTFDCLIDKRIVDQTIYSARSEQDQACFRQVPALPLQLYFLAILRC